MTLLLIFWLLQTQTPVLDNDYVRVTRDVAPCAQAGPECGDRVIVALGALELRSGKSHRKMTRGDVAVFKSSQSYESPSGGPFFEVNIKPNHPPVQSPREIIRPEKNAIRYEGQHFFVFEERLAAGDTRARHSHSQRVVMQLNATRLQQWPDGGPEVFVDTVQDRPTFNPPVIHKVRNIGDTPLRGIVIEFKPERAKGRPGGSDQLTQPRPDLSGKWILDLGKSKLGRERAPLKITSVTLLISHQDPMLTLTETTDYQGLEVTEYLTCFTDGRGETNLTPIRSMAMKSTTRWKGTQLRTKSSISSTRPSSEVRNGRDNSFGAPVNNTAYYVSVPILRTEHFSTTVKRELSADGQTLTITTCTQGPDVVKVFRRAS